MSDYVLTLVHGVWNNNAKVLYVAGLLAGIRFQIRTISPGCCIQESVNVSCVYPIA